MKRSAKRNDEEIELDEITRAMGAKAKAKSSQIKSQLMENLKKEFLSVRERSAGIVNDTKKPKTNS